LIFVERVIVAHGNLGTSKGLRNKCQLEIKIVFMFAFSVDPNYLSENYV